MRRANEKSLLTLPPRIKSFFPDRKNDRTQDPCAENEGDVTREDICEGQHPAEGSKIGILDSVVFLDTRVTTIIASVNAL